MIKFEVHLESMCTRDISHQITAPFPGCRFNGEEKRWEWSCQYVNSLTDLIRALGYPVKIHPLASKHGDLDVLEVCDASASSENDE